MDAEMAMHACDKQQLGLHHARSRQQQLLAQSLRRCAYAFKLFGTRGARLDSPGSIALINAADSRDECDVRDEYDDPE